MGQTQDAGFDTVAWHASLDRVGINTGFVRAVLDGHTDGQLLAVKDGAARYARHVHGMSLVWGDGVPDAFDDLVEVMAAHRPETHSEWLQVDPRWSGLPWRAAFQAAGLLADPDSADQVRVNFTFDPARFDAVRSAHTVPDGWVIVPATAEDFAMTGAVVPSQFWHSAEHWLQHGGGWRAQRDGEPGALAFVAFPAYAGVEIGIETAAEHRGRGLGAAVAVAMIDSILRQGQLPVWACRLGNGPSYRLARRLGFVPSSMLPYFHLA